MESIRTPSSAPSTPHRLHETICDGEYEYGSTSYFTASNPEDVEHHVREYLAVYFAEDDETPPPWTPENQRHKYPINGGLRYIRIEVRPVPDLFQELGIECLLAPESVRTIREALEFYEDFWRSQTSPTVEPATEIWPIDRARRELTTLCS